MSRNTFLRSLFLTVLGLFLMAASASAQDVAAVQQRIRERLPEIDRLKLAATVGENNQGYLEARGSLSSEESKLIREENADRRTLYNVVARQSNTPLAEVEKQRAVRIAAQARAGIWLQNAEGEWYRK